MLTPDVEVKAARQRAIEARAAAEAAAADYRAAVGAAVAGWKAQGLSLRKCAARIGISEGALRDLLRPAGLPRRTTRPARTRRPAP